MAAIVKYIAMAEEAVFDGEEAAEDYVAFPTVTPKEQKTFADQDDQSTTELGGSEIAEEFATVDFDMYVNCVDGIGWILKWLLGDPTSAQVATTTAYTHTYKSDDTLKSFTLLICGEDLNEVPYPGQIMKSLELSSAAGGYLMATISTYGANKDADNAAGAPSFSAVVPLMHKDIYVEIDDTDCTKYIKSISFTFNNNPEEGEFSGGSTEIQFMPKNDTRRMEWSIEFSRYYAAARTAWEAGDAIELDVYWRGAEIEAGNYYQLDVLFGVTKIAEYDHPIDKRTENHSMSGFALTDSGDASEVVVVLTNTDTDYPDA